MYLLDLLCIQNDFLVCSVAGSAFLATSEGSAGATGTLGAAGLSVCACAYVRYFLTPSRVTSSSARVLLVALTAIKAAINKRSILKVPQTRSGKVFNFARNASIPDMKAVLALVGFAACYPFARYLGQ